MASDDLRKLFNLPDLPDSPVLDVDAASRPRRTPADPITDLEMPGLRRQNALKRMDFRMATPVKLNPEEPDAGPGVNVNTGPTKPPSEADPQAPQPRLAGRLRTRPSSNVDVRPAINGTSAMSQLLGQDTSLFAPGGDREAQGVAPSLQTTARSPRERGDAAAMPPSSGAIEASGVHSPILSSMQKLLMGAAPTTKSPWTAPSSDPGFDQQMEAAQQQAARGRRSAALSRSLSHATELITHGAVPMDKGAFDAASRDAERPVQDLMQRAQLKQNYDKLSLQRLVDEANIDRKKAQTENDSLKAKLADKKEREEADARVAENERKAKADAETVERDKENARHHRRMEEKTGAKAGEKALQTKDALDDAQDHLDALTDIANRYQKLPGQGLVGGNVDERAFDLLEKSGNPGGILGKQKDGSEGTAVDARNWRLHMGQGALAKESALSKAVFRNPNNMKLIRGTYGLLQSSSDANVRQGLEIWRNALERERKERGLSTTPPAQAPAKPAQRKPVSQASDAELEAAANG